MNSSDPRYPPLPASQVPSTSEPPLPAPPRPAVMVQSAAKARPASASRTRAPRRLHSAADVDAALMSRHPAWVPHLITALGSYDVSLQRAARNALPAFGEAGILAILRAAAHAHGTVREEAVGCLGEWGDARALQPLLLALKHDRRERNVFLALRFMLALIGTMGARHPREAEGLWAQVKADTRLRIRACAALGRLGDVRAMVPLVEMAKSQDRDVALAARQALGSLLPIVAVLPPDQARLVGAEGVPVLLTLLHDLDEPLVRLTLHALRAIGDARALQAVERLAADRSRPFVQQEAAGLLELLRARAMQEQARATLLRQSHAPQTRTPDALLRPAHSPAQSYPDELLRGSNTMSDSRKPKTAE